MMNKIKIPILILGFLVFITPIVGLPQVYENIIVSGFGLLIMMFIYVPDILTAYYQKTKIQNQKTLDSENLESPTEFKNDEQKTETQ